MARTRDPHSATAQFFINVVDNDFLDYPRARTAGATASSARSSRAWTWWTRSRRVKTGSNGFHQDVPVEDVVIERAEVC